MDRIMTTVSELAEQMHVDTHCFYEWARDEDDPLPLRVINGRKRSSQMVVSDWLEWFERNSKPFKEVH